MNEAPSTDSYANEAAKKEEEEAKLAQEDADLIQRAKDFYKLCLQTTAQWREDASEDLRFLAGRQWDDNVKGMREAQGRPALTVNRLPQFVRQITNEQRQSKNAITVNPVDSGADKRTAEVLQGMVRNIEYSSNADAAYVTGGESAARTGLGYWDVSAEYEGEKSFDQKLTIRRIPNPMSVLMDPGAKELAGDDARQALITTDMSKGDWEANFPGKEVPLSAGWEAAGNSPPNWVSRDGVRIHEFRYITDEPDTLWAIPPNMFMEIPEGGAALESELEPAAVAQLKELKVDTRPTTKRKACWCKIAGDQVVEKGEFAGRYLQIVRVVGGELEVDGEQIYESAVRHAKDSQRMFNYFVSAEAEAVALAPKAPWLVAEGQIEGHEKEWEGSNTKAVTVLTYKPTTIGNVPAPAPQRVMAEANVGAISNARMQAADDMKATTGIYDAALGARSNEQSGKAILARTSQGQTSNFHFIDNLAYAMRYTGRILIDLIPKIYSGPRIVRILGEDGKTHEMVPVNGMQGQFRGEDMKKPIQLDAGRYDVAVSMGPSYQSRRQEGAAQLMELARANPQIGQYAGDLLVSAMDIPDGDIIAERLQKLLPAELRPPDENQPPPQMLAQQVQQSQQMIQKLTQELNAAHDRLESKNEDNESKERIAAMQLHVELVKTMAQIQSKEGLSLMQQEAKALGVRLKLLEIDKPVEDQEPQMQLPLNQSQQPQQPPQPQPAQGMPPQGGINGR